MKPDVHFVTFGTKRYVRPIKLQKRNALKFGAKMHLAYDENSPAVVAARAENAGIFSQKRGYGFWLWKPYVILDALRKIPQGDYIVYVDAGVAPVADMSPIIRRYSINCFAPVPLRLRRCWTKRDCFVLMQADEPKYWNAPTVNAAIQAYRNCAESIEFLTELQRLLRDDRLFTDCENKRSRKQTSMISSTIATINLSSPYWS